MSTNPQSDLYDTITECLLSSICIFAYRKIEVEVPAPRSELLEKVRNSAGASQRFLKLSKTLDRSHDVDVVAMESNDLCYCIEVDHTDRIIRVVFRGSSTVADWMTNSKFRMSFCQNPVKKSKKEIKQTAKIGVHSGFRKYLFAGYDENQICEPSHVANCFQLRKYKGSCKYDRIRTKLVELQKAHPGYGIQVTGHSLGGAMATLCSFCLAADNFPVQCLSFASPRLANGNFHRAFQALEISGKLRNLRVVNSDDIVTALPDTAPSFGMATHAFRSNFFLHTGICLHFTKTEHGLYYPNVCRKHHLLDDWKSRSKNAVKRAATITRLVTGTPVPEVHKCEEYTSRVVREKDHLKELSLDNMYVEYFRNIS